MTIGARIAPKPRGILALSYSVRTPLTALAARLVFGAILGAFYRS